MAKGGRIALLRRAEVLPWAFPILLIVIVSAAGQLLGPLAALALIAAYAVAFILLAVGGKSVTRQPWKWSAVVIFVAAVLLTLGSTQLMSIDHRPASPQTIIELNGRAPRQTEINARSLRGADLSGARLDQLDLRGRCLDGADLSGASLIGTHLDGASLRGAVLRGVHLDRASLRGADVTGADLAGADIGDADSAGARGLGTKPDSTTTVSVDCR